MNYTLNCGGRLLSLDTPQVMGILNVTPDSFYATSRVETEEAIARRAHEIVEQGAAIIDVGACSTRPGSEPVSAQQESERLRLALGVIRREMPDAIVSVDTFRPDIVRMAVEELGADIINDVGQSASSVNDRRSVSMYRMVARLGVPYVLMSRESGMSSMLMWLSGEVQALRDCGQKDIIIDPGFGFGKTLEENYSVLRDLEQLQLLELPVLVGVSRKSMIYKLLGVQPDAALNGTSVLHVMALERGAKILRVHDVREAVECVRINKMLYV
jgi:dihydropteroate synthase